MDKDEEIQLPELTPLQFKYVEARKSGKNKSDSYRAATDTSNMAPNTIWSNASQLESHAKVSLWLSTIKVDQITAATYTLSEHLADMARIKDAAFADKSYSAATKACENLGKACDHYTSLIETTVSRKGDLELLDSIEKSLGHDARIEAERRLALH